jgi:hypothetical protein
MKKLILILWAIATAAHATPPDLISLSDRVLGFSDTQVFILRETSDNLGMHAYGMHDVYLVAKNLTTGLDDEIWPVYRVHSVSEPAPKTTSFPLNGAVNPFEILAARAVQYTNYGMQAPESNRAPESTFSADFLQVGGAMLPTDSVKAQLLHAVALTSEAIQPYPESGFISMSFSTPQALLADPSFDIQECYINGVTTLFRYPLPNISMARMSCDDEGERLSFSLIVLIPPEG